MPKYANYWESITPSRKSFPALKGTKQADVVVIGGGMSGLSTAYHFHKAGKRVVALERNICGSGASGHAGGFLTPDVEMSYPELAERFPKATANKLYDLVTSGAHWIMDRVKEYDLACDAHALPAALFTTNAHEISEIKEQHKKNKKRYPSDTFLQGSKVSSMFNAPGNKAMQYYDGHFAINPNAFCRTFSTALAKEGVQIFENSYVTSIEKECVKTTRGEIHAPIIIMATDAPISQQSPVQPPVRCLRTFVAVTAPLDTNTAKNIFPSGPILLWDTKLAYHYLRLLPDNRILFGGGDALGVMMPIKTISERIFHIKARHYLHRLSPDLSAPIDYVWSAFFGLNADLLPNVQKLEHTWFVGGVSGLPWAAACGGYIAEKILHNRSDFDELLGKRNITPKETWEAIM